MLLRWLPILVFGVAVFVVSYQYNKRLLDWLRFQSLGTRDYIVEKLAKMFIEVDPQYVLIGQFVFSVGLGTIVFALLLPNVIPGLLLGIVVTIVGWKVPKPVVDYMYKKRVEKFVLQMQDGLGLMSNGLRSGLSIVQALGLVSQEMENPIKQEFELVMNENKLGVPLEEAFTNLSRRVESDDVEMFVTAINILKETGGNLAETFDTIVVTIRERIKLERKIEAMMSQSLYQGMTLLCVPPGLGFVFYQSDPELMMPLFTDPIGWAVLAIVFILEVACFFMIMKVIKIEV